MNFTFIYNIQNIWYNDSHRISSFISIPFLFILIIYFFKFFIIQFKEYKNEKKINFFSFFYLFFIEIIFIINVLFFIIGITGLFQIIIPPLIDSIIRSFGIFLYINCVILFIIFTKKHPSMKLILLYNKGFYKIVRHPYYLLLILLSLSFSIIVLNIIIVFITIFLLLPIVLLKIHSIEKNIKIKDEYFIDYINSVPKLIPDLLNLLKKIF